MLFSLAFVIFKVILPLNQATFNPVYFQMTEYDEYLVPTDEEDFDEFKLINPFYIDHQTAQKIPLRVNGYTTADLFRDGYRQRKNCHPVLTNDFSTRKPGGRFLNNATDEQRLMCALLQNYTKEVRPVHNFSSALTVNFSLSINQLFDLDDRRQQLILNVWFQQSWKDDSLIWDPNKFNGLKTLNIPSHFIFIPDIKLYNDAGDFSKRRMQFRTMVSSDGTVFYGDPVKLISSCHVNPTWYPFDTQVCRLKFGSWTYSGLEIDLQTIQGTVDTSNMLTDGQWKVAYVVKIRHSVIYTCCPEPYVDISYYLILKRRPIYYILTIYFFSTALTGMTLAVYQLPVDSREKCSLGGAVLFSLSVFMLSCTEKLPESSEYIPIVNIYLSIVMAMCSVSLMTTTVISALYFHKSKLVSGYPGSAIARLPFLLVKCVKCHRKGRENAADESFRTMQKKIETIQDFIKKLRGFRRSLDEETNSELDYLQNGSEGTLTGSIEINLKILEIRSSIEKLADAYERKVRKAYILIEWQELAQFLDGVLFWVFCLLFLLAMFFVVGYSSYQQGIADYNSIIAKFEENEKKQLMT